MGKKLITIAFLAFTLAMPGVASPAGDPNNNTPSSPGACNMFNGANGMNGMFNDPHFSDIMYPLVVASFTAGCTPVR